MRFESLVLAVAAVAIGTSNGVRNNAPPVRADWRDSVRLLNERHFKHAAWGTAHSRRDYDVARSIADSEHWRYDDDVLFAAAYLHDIAAFAPWEQQGVDHQDRGAALMDSVLTGFGFPVEKIARVKDAIRTHMTTRSPGPAVESGLLHDADGLDWLGAIGIARVMALVDANGGDPNFAWAVSRLRDDAEKVPMLLVTPAGRREAARRAAETFTFLGALKGQTKEFGAL